jgi:hypothetical protein
VLALAAVVLLAGPLVRVFVSDPAIAGTARHALRIIALAIAAAGITPLVSAYFQSLGRPRPSYLLSLGTLLVLKIPLVIVLGHAGTDGIWLSLALGELASALAALITLRLRDRPDERRSNEPGSNGRGPDERRSEEREPDGGGAGLGTQDVPSAPGIALAGVPGTVAEGAITASHSADRTRADRTRKVDRDAP